MGLIADIVESFKAALGGIAQGDKAVANELNDELGQVSDAVNDAAETFLADEDVDFPEAVRQAFLFLLSPGVFVGKSPSGFASGLIEGWTKLLTTATDQLNIDAPEGPVVAIEDINAQIEAEIQRGGAEAQKRVAVVVAVVNLVVITGNAASIAAELASVGTVRSISDAVQSWVWVNGLGGMSSMAYSPQMNASVGPWLDRIFNDRAQAKLPGPADLVRFQLREVFLAGRREELIGTEERGVFDRYMRQLGFSKFWADSYWGAHWVLPSISQLNEMLFRGVIDEDTWERFVRFNDLEPTSIPRLKEIIFNPYTRVDVRRMHRMGILDDLELLQAYADLGFFAPTTVDATGRIRAVFVPTPDFTVHRAQALVIFTKVFNALPELRARFRRGHINRDELLTALRGTGIPPDRAQKLWETIVDAEAKARTAPERELTRGLIARAWKQELISFAQGVFLLERIGWETAEAELILRVTAEVDVLAPSFGTALGLRLTGGIEQPEFGFEEAE